MAFNHFKRGLLTGLALIAIGAESRAAQQPHPGAIESIPPSSELERTGARFGSIYINVRPIFDPDIPGERTLLFRTANRLHIDTKARTIRAQLLFATGDLFSERLLRETERNIRTLRFVREPQIRVTGVRGDLVDVEVRTTDTWTLEPSVTYGRRGGVNKSSFGFVDQNFLGLGKRLELDYHRDRDRNGTTIGYSDPNIGFGRAQMELEYQDNSDGHLAFIDVSKPFYELLTRDAMGAAVLDRDGFERRYALGEEADVYRRRETSIDLHYGRSQGLVGRWVLRKRFGLRFEDLRFSQANSAPSIYVPPSDRRLLYPYIQYEWIEDDFTTTFNRDQIGRTEDEVLGRRWLAEIGISSQSAGSDRSALLFRGEFSDGLLLSQRQSAFLDVTASGRANNRTIRNGRLGIQARYYLRFDPKNTLYAGLKANLGTRLDADDEFLLGGDNGLRAYPIAFQTGEKSALVTLEHRYYTDWQPLRLFTVGAAAFVDVGRVWGPNSIDAPQLGTLSEFGIGLRFGSLRSARPNVLHVDLAWPLDDPSRSGPQLMVETRRSL